jgi:Flp pilus assembly protein TadD
MSLLLDALKKSGGQQQSTGLSDLTLEELPASRASSAAPSASAAMNTASRSAGETMFAAKKKKPSSGMRWNLGLVPSTLLFAVIFGSGYGYYVWLQIQPPKQPRIAQRTTPPPAPPAPVMAAAPALVPFIPPQETTAPEATRPDATARNEEFDAPRNKPRTTQNRSRNTGSGVAIQRKVQTDAITPSLLNAYQAYQRGDYVTAGQEYREVLSRDSRNRDALLGLAAIAQQQGQDETAQHYYRQLLVINPRDPAAQAALSTYASDGSSNTESRLKKMLAEQPQSGALNFALGNYYADQSSWGDAQQYYFNAHTLEPSNAQFAFNLAVSLDHLGQRKLAAQFYQQALQLDTSGNSGFDHAQAQQRLNELTPAH